MAEQSRQTLIRVSSGDEGSHHISYAQRRQPYWGSVINGWRHGPSNGNFFGHTFFVEQLSCDTRNRLTVAYSGLRCAGFAGLALGSEKNQVDVCMWGVPNEAPIESDLFDVSELQIDEGEIVHNSQGIFDRRVVLPIHAGTLSVHLAEKEWDPIVL